MKLTDKQVERYEKAWIEHLKLEKELAYAEVAGEVKETEEKLAAVGIGALVFSVRLIIRNGFSFEKKEEVVEGEPIDDEELD